MRAATDRRSAVDRLLPALALLAIAGCSDELSGPRTDMCDDQVEFSITEPAEVHYFVAVTGEAVVSHVTYTTPAGDTTLVNPADESGDELLLRRDIAFTEPGDARLRVRGEVASNGEIGFTYSIVPDDTAKSVIAGPTSVCNSATQ